MARQILACCFRSKAILTMLATFLVLGVTSLSIEAMAWKGSETKKPVEFYDAYYITKISYNVVGLIRTSQVDVKLDIAGDQVTGFLYAESAITGSLPLSGTRKGGICRLVTTRGDSLTGRCDERGFDASVTIIGLGQVQAQPYSYRLAMGTYRFNRYDGSYKLRPYRATAYQSFNIASFQYGRGNCDPGLDIRAVDESKLDGVLFPLETDLDTIMAKHDDCGFPSFVFKNGRGKFRIFPGIKPYYLDPFGSGTEQSELAQTTAEFSNITAYDALTEPAIWRLISAVSIFEASEEYFKGISNFPDSANWQRHAVMKATDLDRARKVVAGAKNKAVRALLWQYKQMQQADDFPLEQCRRFGELQWALGFGTVNKPPQGALTKDWEHLAYYNEHFRKQALPKLLASFGKIPDYTQLIDDRTGKYTSRVWQAVPYYDCVRDGTDFVLNETSNTIKVSRTAQLEAERFAAETEAKRQSLAAAAALERNLRAATGNFAPVDDDVLRATIDAQRESVETGIALGDTLMPGGSFAQRYNYEAGFYWDRMTGLQEFAFHHSVRNTNCNRITKQPIVYDCRYEMKVKISATIFGMTLPTIDAGFQSHSEQVEFLGGRWVIKGLAARYAQARRGRSSNYDHGKGIKDFQCISSNNFAQQFGMVPDIDCVGV